MRDFFFRVSIVSTLHLLQRGTVTHLPKEPVARHPGTVRRASRVNRRTPVPLAQVRVAKPFTLAFALGVAAEHNRIQRLRGKKDVATHK